MRIMKYKDAVVMGEKAAIYAADSINRAIAEQGSARVVFSTGQSQFTFLNALRNQAVDWSQVTMFHLDEYIGISEEHPASFVRYLKERFTYGLPLARIRFINGMADTGEEIASLNAEISESPIDVAFIGIGENGHIAFNDPPADFETKTPYFVVNLNDTCKRQQVREGWFSTIEDVPKQAISMSPRHIMASKVIISVVPYKVKADAIQKMLHSPLDCRIPCTILKEHPDCTLFLDDDSGAGIKVAV